VLVLVVALVAIVVAVDVVVVDVVAVVVVVFCLRIHHPIQRSISYDVRHVRGMRPNEVTDVMHDCHQPPIMHIWLA